MDPDFLGPGPIRAYMDPYGHFGPRWAHFCPRGCKFGSKVQDVNVGKQKDGEICFQEEFVLLDNYWIPGQSLDWFGQPMDRSFDSEFDFLNKFGSLRVHIASFENDG